LLLLPHNTIRTTPLFPPNKKETDDPLRITSY
jgi:hypothetical protein